MAMLVTITLLVDDPDEVRVTDGVKEMLSAAQTPVEEGQPSWIVDWAVDAVQPVLSELDDSIVNETYEDGDLSRDWVVFSATEAQRDTDDERYGYWSNEYGWTTLDLATRFDPIKRNLPSIGVPDAVWMICPDR